MKKLIILCMAVCFATASFAQKGKLNLAKQAYESGKIADAYTAIKAASVHDKTKDNPETWVLKSQILSTAKISPTVSEILGIDISDEEVIAALDKAKTLDTEGKYSEQIKTAATNIMSNIHNSGVQAFNDEKDYALASQLFREKKAFKEKYMADEPIDTLDILIIGASELELGNEEEGMKYYEQLTELGFDDKGVYNTVILYYQEKEGEDEKFLKALRNAQKVYPEDGNYKLMEIDYMVENGKVEEALNEMLAASEANPENANLMTTIASVYKAQDDIATERQWLEKALSVDPDHYEANFNLGVSYFNDAVKYNEEMNFMSSTTSQEYTDAKAQRDALGEKAYPLFVKSYEAKPTNQNVLRALVQYYRMQDDSANMEKYQAELDATGY